MTRNTTFVRTRVAAAVMAATVMLSLLVGPAAALGAANSSAAPAAPAAPAATKPSAAPAASAAAASASAAVPLAPKGQVEVQLWPSKSSSLLVVSLQLPDTATLPARVRIPLPEGASVTWAGEITGSDAAKDIPRSFTTITVSGGRAIEFVAQSARSLQYEADLPAPAVAGDQVSTTLKWVQSVDALGVNPAVKTPAGATDTQITPAPADKPRTNTVGEALYTLPQQHPELGGAFTIQISFAQGVAGSTPQTTGEPGGRSTVLYILVAILVLVIGFVVVLALRPARPRAIRGDHDQDEEYGEEPTA